MPSKTGTHLLSFTEKQKLYNRTVDLINEKIPQQQHVTLLKDRLLEQSIFKLEWVSFCMTYRLT